MAGSLSERCSFEPQLKFGWGFLLSEEIGEQLGYGAVEGGVDEGGSDLGEGGEDEAALVHGGVGEGEVGERERLTEAVIVDVEE